MGIAICHLSSSLLRPRQNGRHFADDIFKCIFLNEHIWIPIKISLKFVPKCPVNNIPSLVQIMAWRRPGDKPLSEPIMVSLLTYICVTRPQWVNLINMPSYPPLWSVNKSTFRGKLVILLHTSNTCGSRHSYTHLEHREPGQNNNICYMEWKYWDGSKIYNSNILIHMKVLTSWTG